MEGRVCQQAQDEHPVHTVLQVCQHMLLRLFGKRPLTLPTCVYSYSPNAFSSCSGRSKVVPLSRSG